MTLNIGTIADYQDWTKKVSSKVISIDFVRFGIVGGCGFVLNTIFLTVFYKLFHLPLIVSQLFAAEIALLFNYTLHNIWTYKSGFKRKSWLRGLLFYHGSSWSGILITTTILIFTVNVLHLNYLIGLTIGVTITMFWNYTWTRYVIFRSTKKVKSINS
jgi:putative flippase GtrA